MKNTNQKWFWLAVFLLMAGFCAEKLSKAATGSLGGVYEVACPSLPLQPDIEILSFNGGTESNCTEQGGATQALGTE